MSENYAPQKPLGTRRTNPNRRKTYAPAYVTPEPVVAPCEPKLYGASGDAFATKALLVAVLARMPPEQIEEIFRHAARLGANPQILGNAREVLAWNAQKERSDAMQIFNSMEEAVGIVNAALSKAGWPLDAGTTRKLLLSLRALGLVDWHEAQAAAPAMKPDRVL